MYALEALAPDESLAYASHLQTCRTCQELVGQFQQAADLLPEALEAPAASTGLRQRVLDQAAAEAVPRSDAPAPPSVTARPGGSWWRWPGWLSPLPAGAIAVLLMAVAGLVVWNVTLAANLENQDRLLTEQNRLLQAITRGSPVSHVSGTPAAPGASAALVLDPENQQFLLIVRGLPDLPGDREYQVWHIRDDRESPVGAGTFSVTSTGQQLVIISVDFSTADAIGVSVEPRGGSQSPTGDIVLLGEL